MLRWVGPLDKKRFPRRIDNDSLRKINIGRCRGPAVSRHALQSITGHRGDDSIGGNLPNENTFGYEQISRPVKRNREWEIQLCICSLTTIAGMTESRAGNGGNDAVRAYLADTLVMRISNENASVLVHGDGVGI